MGETTTLLLNARIRILQNESMHLTELAVVG